MKIELVEDCKYDIELIVLKNFKSFQKSEKKILKKSGFEAKENQIELIGSRLFVGIEKFKNEDIKIAFANAIKFLKKSKFEKIKIDLARENQEYKLEDIVQGLLLGSYEFDKYKSKKSENKKRIFIDISKSAKSKENLQVALEKSLNICSSVNMVRDIVNTAPEDFYPKTMASKAKEIAKNNNLECKIYGEEYLKINNYNAMYAVGRASRHESQLIHLNYKPSNPAGTRRKNPKGKIVLVGKGLTYDCGGLSLKSGEGMVSMKCDKSGASALLGIMNSLNAINCEYEVDAILGAVENMIGGDAYKPDDILKAKNGVTIEVRNTDAEGRLVLADCLCYAQENIKDIDTIFDFATLTGACIIGLGEYTSAVLGHNEKLKKQIKQASKKSGELVGFLPFNRYLPNMIKSEIADIVNSTSSKAGSTITAALFLDKFIKKENKKKWLHFDIAGPAYREKSWGYNPYGATGAAVRLILEFLQREK
ncbi:MAG: leucyl aminopeptidase [Halarcobacter sp.]